jgi:hypothetical protein
MMEIPEAIVQQYVTTRRRGVGAGGFRQVEVQEHEFEHLIEIYQAQGSSKIKALMSVMKNENVSLRDLTKAFRNIFSLSGR